MKTAARLGRPTALVAAGQAAVKSTQLVLALVLVRLLSDTSWNQVAFVLSIHLALVTFGALGLQHSLLYFLARHPGGERSIVLRTAAMTTAVGLAALGILALLADRIGGQLQVESLLPLVGIAATLELCTVGMPSAFIALERFRSAAVWDVANSLVVVVAVGVAAATTGTARGVVVALLAAAAMRLLAFVVVVPLTIPHSPGAVRPSRREQLVYSLPLGLTLAASVLNRTLDKWYVAAFDPSQVGHYTLAAQEIPLLAVLPYAGGAVVAAELARSFRDGDTNTAAALWHRQTSSMARLVVPMSVALMLVAPELLRLLAGETSRPMVLTFQLFTAITLHRVAEYGLLLRAAGRPRTVLVSASVLLGANAILALVGAVLWGAVGAAAGTLLANVVAWVFVLRQVGAALGTGFAQAFPWSEWGWAVGLSALAALVAAQLAGTVHTTLAALVVKGTSFAALVLVAQRWRRSRVDDLAGAIGEAA
jgi:O-antigen/teichoic acid export membrane protein